MKRKIALMLCAVFVLVICLSGCAKYKEEDFIGKTSAQIEAEFGSFDCRGRPADADGLYRKTACGYTIREPKTGYFGTEPEVLIFIAFDENGIAYDTYEGNRPGG